MAVLLTGPGAATRISTNAGAVCRTGAGTLRSLTINKKGGSANIATVYDSVDTSGTVLAIIDTTAAVGTLFYNCVVAAGVYVVLSTGTAADVTVVTS